MDKEKLSDILANYGSSGDWDMPQPYKFDTWVEMAKELEEKASKYDDLDLCDRCASVYD